jgi:hypothetical protein
MSNLPATEGAGKGDWPRPVNKKKYDANYDRIFGRICTMCNGRGYFWDWCQMQKKMLKTSCIICGGKGRIK